MGLGPYPIMIPLPKQKLDKGGLLASPIRLVWTYLKSNTSSLGPNLGMSLLLLFRNELGVKQCHYYY